MKLTVNITAYLPHQHASQSPFEGHTVTGAVTVTTFPSSINSSRALWHSSRTCASGIGRQARSCAMALWSCLSHASNLGGSRYTCRGRSSRDCRLCRLFLIRDARKPHASSSASLLECFLFDSNPREVQAHGMVAERLKARTNASGSQIACSPSPKSCDPTLSADSQRKRQYTACLVSRRGYKVRYRDHQHFPSLDIDRREPRSALRRANPSF